MKKKVRKPVRAKRTGARSPKTRRQQTRQAAPASIGLKKFETEIGITVHENKPHRLILVENALDGIEPADFATRQAYAEKMGGDQPSRIDALVLFQRAKAKFKTDRPYGTNETYAGSSSGAWGQWFYTGDQRYWSKSNAARVCVVRRSPL